MAPQQKIQSFRKKYPKEWLLMRVTKVDSSTTTPLAGRLIAHSPDRDVIYKKSINQKGLLLIDHAQKKLPKGYAVAF